MNTKTIPELIEQRIANASSYDAYRTQVHELLQKGKSTGAEQSEALTKYSMLNDRRMKRLDKTIKINPTIAKRFKEASIDMTWLVLTEGWCGDAAQSLPVIHKLASLNSGISLKIISRDAHNDLMEHFLTNGGKAIPKLIMYDSKEKKVVQSWGPRPSTATAMVNTQKEKYGHLDADFKEALQGWYNKDKGQNIVEDITKMVLLQE